MSTVPVEEGKKGKGRPAYKGNPTATTQNVNLGATKAPKHTIGNDASRQTTTTKEKEAIPSMGIHTSSLAAAGVDAAELVETLASQFSSAPAAIALLETAAATIREREKTRADATPVPASMAPEGPAEGQSEGTVIGDKAPTDRGLDQSGGQPCGSPHDGSAPDQVEALPLEPVPRHQNVKTSQQPREAPEGIPLGSPLLLGHRPPRTTVA